MARRYDPFSQESEPNNDKFIREEERNKQDPYSGNNRWSERGRYRRDRWNQKDDRFRNNRTTNRSTPYNNNRNHNRLNHHERDYRSAYSHFFSEDDSGRNYVDPEKESVSLLYPERQGDPYFEARTTQEEKAKPEKKMNFYDRMMSMGQAVSVRKDHPRYLEIQKYMNERTSRLLNQGSNFMNPDDFILPKEEEDEQKEDYFTEGRRENEKILRERRLREEERLRILETTRNSGNQTKKISLSTPPDGNSKIKEALTRTLGRSRIEVIATKDEPEDDYESSPSPQPNSFEDLLKAPVQKTKEPKEEDYFSRGRRLKAEQTLRIQKEKETQMKTDHSTVSGSKTVKKPLPTLPSSTDHPKAATTQKPMDKYDHQMAKGEFVLVDRGHPRYEEIERYNRERKVRGIPNERGDGSTETTVTEGDQTTSALIPSSESIQKDFEDRRSTEASGSTRKMGGPSRSTERPGGPSGRQGGQDRREGVEASSASSDDLPIWVLLVIALALLLLLSLPIIGVVAQQMHLKEKAEEAKMRESRKKKARRAEEEEKKRKKKKKEEEVTTGGTTEGTTGQDPDSAGRTPTKSEMKRF